MFGWFGTNALSDVRLKLPWTPEKTKRQIWTYHHDDDGNNISFSRFLGRMRWCVGGRGVFRILWLRWPVHGMTTRAICSDWYSSSNSAVKLIAMWSIYTSATMQGHNNCISIWLAVDFLQNWPSLLFLTFMCSCISFVWRQGMLNWDPN